MLKFIKLFIAGAIFLNWPGLCQAQQNWLSYFDMVNRAEEEFVVNNNAEKSCKIYDSAFAVYQKPFVSDLYVAAEIAYYANDSKRFVKYITACFNRGMTFQCLNNAKLFAPVFKDSVLLSQLHQVYENRKVPAIDMALHDSVYFHKYREQMIKKTLGRDRKQFPEMHRITKENVAYFNTFLDMGVFPSEQMIGLYSEDDKEAFLKKYNLETFEQPLPKSLMAGNTSMTIMGIIPDDYELSNKSALLSYLHYPCGFEQNKEKFWTAVVNGYFHAKDYCMMEEWFAKSFGNPNYEHDCIEKRDECYYNICYELRVTSAGQIEQVEKNRAAKHIQKFSVDMLKRKLKEEKGFEFFFGFLSLR